MRTKFLHNYSAAAPIHVPSQPRSFIEVLVILQAIVISKYVHSFNHSAFMFPGRIHSEQEIQEMSGARGEQRQ